MVPKRFPRALASRLIASSERDSGGENIERSYRFTEPRSQALNGLMLEDFDDGLPADAAQSELRSRFTITPLLDTEIDVAAAGLVGLTPEADHDLRVDVTSAVIARFMSVSIATARKYMRDTRMHVCLLYTSPSPRDS